jgi:hypothetical protein
MRDTATLTRSTCRSAFAETESATRPLLIRRATLILAGLFVLSAVIGWGVTSLLPTSTAQQISTPEYTALVAQLFVRDQNSGIARERLALYGSPADMAQQAAVAARAGQLSIPADVAAVDALVTALTGVPAAPTANGEVAPIASAQPTSDRTSWLGPLLAFGVAFALGIVVLLRTAGLSLGFIHLPTFRRSWIADRAKSTPRRSGLPGRFDSDAPRHTALSISEATLGEDDEEFDDVGSIDSIGVPTSVSADRAAARPARKGAGLAYQSIYRLGDDPFDEIHPISDAKTGGLVAACGLSSALKFDSLKVGGYYAFAAWIQDYGNADELHAAGLVAPGAPEAARGQIESWVRGGQIDTVLSLEVGASALIGSPALAATVTVVDVEFGLSGDDEDSYVTRLVLKFEVQRRVEHSAPAPRELAQARR